jgi:hypothetical protein
MDVIGLVSFALFFTLLIILAIGNIKLRISNKKHKREIEQLGIDNLMLLKKVSDLFNELNIKELENTNGFIGFLEKSRDWAFEYIEVVQQSLAEFDKVASSVIKWSATYGITLGDNAHQDKLNEISEAYAKLKSLLPDETKQGETNE